MSGTNLMNRCTKPALLVPAMLVSMLLGCADGGAPKSSQPNASDDVPSSDDGSSSDHASGAGTSGTLDAGKPGGDRQMADASKSSPATQRADAGHAATHTDGSVGDASGADAPVAPGDAGGSGSRARDAGETGTLPTIADPALAGPFTITEEDNVGPDNDYTTIAPKQLGQDGVMHPILIWGPGAGAWPGIYQSYLNHIASHGFVIVSYNSTPDGPELTTAVDWIVSEAKREGSVYFNKVDTSKIAMGGQSAGSLGTFKAAKDTRLTTTLHINGGTFDPHTDVANLIKPALFLCGDEPDANGGDGIASGDLARPNCDIDYMNAAVPVWYGDVIGASHTTVIDNPLGDAKPTDDPLFKPFLAATIAWLRWQLVDDQQMKALLVGPSCGFCTETTVWKVQQKGLQ